MKEIGGYIELDRYHGYMLHDGAIALNCARNALAYLIRSRDIKKIYIPKFLCDSVYKVCEKMGVRVKLYSIDEGFLPKEMFLEEDEWLYVVNFYGQLKNEEILQLKQRYDRIIVDNVQAYFQMPVPGIDTIYTCRKFFGVADGAFLYTDASLNEEFPIDESFERMGYLLGRFERSASEFYTEYVANNEMFEKEPVKKMSLLTENLLRAIDYQEISKRRTENYTILHRAFSEINMLKLQIPEGAFMYPLYVEDGYLIRQKLQQKKIYIPTLWPDVFDWCEEEEYEYGLAKNVLPLPCDQRYDEDDMLYIIDSIVDML